MKEVGCNSGNPLHAIAENEALAELVKYCMALRDLDREKSGITKDTKKKIENKVNTLMSM